MEQKKRSLLNAMAAAVVMLGASPLASAAVNQPYAVNVAYDSGLPRATVTWGADAPSAYGYGIERRPVGRADWHQVAYVNEPVRSYVDNSVAPLVRYEYRVKAYRPGGPAEGYISTSTATTQLHFPYNRGYGRGILPNNYTQAQMNADVRTMYDLWRATYVTTAGAGAGGARVYKPAESGVTVSEGQGYGMLISVYMADATNNGKSDFDKMLTYYKAKLKTNPDGSSRGLMNWKINADGTVADPWVAPDGDLDAAFALLVADRKFGSGYGNPNYWAEAQSIINALQQWAVYNRTGTASRLIANADKDAGVQELATSVALPSYQMVGYMQAFEWASDATRAAQWRETRKAGYKMLDYFYDLNPSTALTPYNFLSQPGAGQYQPTTKPYTFGPDSCRVPWRLGIDYLWHGNTGTTWANGQDASIRATLAQDLPKVNVAWFMNSVGNNPSNAWYKYELNGTPAAGPTHWGQRHTAGSMAVGAMTDASNQARLNALYSWMRQQTPGASFTDGSITIGPEYYADTVLMVTMLAVTGNMPNLPEVAVPLQ